MSGLYVMGCEAVERKISCVFTTGMLKWSHKTTPGQSSTIKSEMVKRKNRAGFRR